MRGHTASVDCVAYIRKLHKLFLVAGLIAMLEVEAWVVDIRNAAYADDDGILNPLLHRYQARTYPAQPKYGSTTSWRQMTGTLQSVSLPTGTVQTSSLLLLDYCHRHASADC